MQIFCQIFTEKMLNVREENWSILKLILKIPIFESFNVIEKIDKTKKKKVAEKKHRRTLSRCSGTRRSYKAATSTWNKKYIF